MVPRADWRIAAPIVATGENLIRRSSRNPKRAVAALRCMNRNTVPSALRIRTGAICRNKPQQPGRVQRWRLTNAIEFDVRNGPRSFIAPAPPGCDSFPQFATGEIWTRLAAKDTVRWASKRPSIIDRRPLCCSRYAPRKLRDSLRCLVMRIVAAHQGRSSHRRHVATTPFSRSLPQATADAGYT